MTQERVSGGRFAPGNQVARRQLAEAVWESARHDAAESKIQILPHHDGWESALTAIGTHRDKREHGHFRTRLRTWEELLELYRTNDLARRAIEGPVKTSLAGGYVLSITDSDDDDLKSLVEEEFTRLEVDKFVERAMCVERAFGGSAILLGINDGNDYSQPLDFDHVTSFDWLTVIEPVELWANTYYDDPNSAKFGEIETYRVSALGIGVPGTQQDGRLPPPDSQVIHETRLIVFSGVRVSRYQRQSSFLGVNWGDSMLLPIYDALRDFETAYASAGILATDFSQSVFHMKNLASLVAREPTKLAARMSAIELGRSTARAVLVDTEEKFERQSTRLSGFPELLDRLAQRLAAAIDMPLSVLLGQNPGSLGSDGSADVRYYYDRIRTFQRRVVGPILRRMAALVMRANKKAVPKKWGIKFAPLWELTVAEMAEAQLTQARADTLAWKGGAVTSDEWRNRFRRGYSFDLVIDPDKKAPGQPPLPAQSPPIAPPGGWPPGHPMSGKPFPTPPPGGPADASGAPVKAGVGNHVVGGYARRNPIKKAPDAFVKGGGAGAPNDAAGKNLARGGRAKADGMGGGGAGVGLSGAEGVFVGGMPTPPAGDGERKLRLKDAVDRLACADASEFARALADVVHVAMGGALGGSTPGANRSDRIVHQGGRWHVTSEDGSKSLGSYPSKIRAIRRLRQVEFFKEHSDALPAGSEGDDLIHHSLPRPTTYAGLPVLVENEVGSTRFWIDPDGSYNSTLMKLAYGCIEGAIGADDEDVDVYIGTDEGAENAYIIHQMKAPNFTEYDEDKVMLGQSTAASAAAAYLSQYDDPRFFGGMDVLPMDELRAIVTGGPGMVGKIVGDPVVPPEVVRHSLERSIPKAAYGANRIALEDDASNGSQMTACAPTLFMPSNGKTGFAESDARLANAFAKPEITSASAITDDDTRRPPGKEINLEGFEVDNTESNGYPGHYAVGGDGNFTSDDPKSQMTACAPTLFMSDPKSSITAPGTPMI